jgi:AcrR family transcriptional regulator
MSVAPDAGPDSGPTADNARARLLNAGLQLFAQQGFSKTSTRELAELAQVNVAAISYYFGDKAGLYRAVFTEPMGDVDSDVALIAAPGLSLDQALHGFFQGFLQPLADGESTRLCVKLHFREMLEPTGLWEDHFSHGIRPVHDALLQVLQRHLGVAEPDDELQGLVVCLAALGVHLYVGHDVTEQLAPSLIHHPQALPRWSERLVRLGRAMVESERSRRAAEPHP